MFNQFRPIGLAAISLIVTGCGVTSPTLQEAWGTPQDAALIKQNMVAQSSCELRQAVKKWVFKEPFKYNFLRDWIAVIEILTDVDEKTAITPAVSFNDPIPNATTLFSAGRVLSTPQSYSLGIGATFSTEAHAIDKLFITYKVSDFIDKTVIKYDCFPDPDKGSLFPRVPLYLEEWLRGSIDVAYSQSEDSDVGATGHFPKVGGGTPAVLSHDITFEIVTSGSITPTWKLLRVGTGSNPLAMANRDRKQEIILTMSPPDKASANQLGPLGVSAVISSDNAATIRRIQQ